MTRLVLWLAVMACVASPAGARAQAAANVSLSVPSAGTAFPAPTVTDYLNGYIDNPAVFTFSGVLKGPANGTAYYGHVEICALSADLGQGKPLADLLWRPSDLSKPYQPISQGCDGPLSSARLVGSYLLEKFQNQRNYSGGVIFRLLLRWTDSAASYGTPLGMTVSMTY